MATRIVRAAMVLDELHHTIVLCRKAQSVTVRTHFSPAESQVCGGGAEFVTVESLIRDAKRAPLPMPPSRQDAAAASAVYEFYEDDDDGGDVEVRLDDLLLTPRVFKRCRALTRRQQLGHPNTLRALLQNRSLCDQIARARGALRMVMEKPMPPKKMRLCERNDEPLALTDLEASESGLSDEDDEASQEESRTA